MSIVLKLEKARDVQPKENLYLTKVLKNVYNFFEIQRIDFVVECVYYVVLKYYYQSVLKWRI